MRWPGLATTPMLPARRVLVAGGGTGQEPIRLAVMHPELEVHVIDLSRRSLAYGARQAKRFGVDGRVHFAQADLLDLEQLGDRLGDFDRVYSSGVLHHLADPMEGLRAVVSRLKPGGVAQLALYSRAARASVNEGRAAAQQLGLGTELSDVRALRRFVLEHADRDAFRRIMGFRDFYSTSECRDLLLHVQEHQFDLAEVAGMLQAVGLKFLVFTFEDPRVDLRFRAEFGESRQSDLDAWNAYEAKYPDTFKAMYQFLAVKTPPDEA
jgi:SAM-dependent methyltransferase